MIRGGGHGERQGSVFDKGYGEDKAIFRYVTRRAGTARKRQSRTVLYDLVTFHDYSLPKDHERWDIKWP